MLNFEEPKKSVRWPDLAPMLDVIFLLLIFFMLTSLYAHPVIPVDLPGAESGESAEEKSITIVLDPSGTIYVNGESTPEHLLEERLRNTISDPKKTHITLHADEKSSFGQFLTIMDKSRLCGVSNISIATDRAEAYEE